MERKKNSKDQYDTDSMDSNTEFDSLYDKKFFFFGDLSKKKK